MTRCVSDIVTTINHVIRLGRIKPRHRRAHWFAGWRPVEGGSIIASAERGGGLLHPSAGEVLIDGVRPYDDPGVYRRLGLVPEREAVPLALTGFEFVLMNARLQGMAPRPAAKAAAAAIERVELAGDAHRPTREYSKGMRQRIKVAAMLVHDPAILLLDEPFSGMDPRQRMSMMDLLRSFADDGRIVLVSSHILEELSEIASSVLVMVGGRLAASGPFHEIRAMMTDRPHSFTVQSSDDRRLAAAVVTAGVVYAIEMSATGLVLRTADRGALIHALPMIARDAGIRVLEVRPSDESLESVFSYLVAR